MSEQLPPLTKARAIEILDQMIEFGPNLAIKASGYNVGQFFKLLSRESDLMNLYLANQQLYTEIKAVEVIDIADSPGDPAVAKNKILSRQWFAGRILHKKYGDKLSVDHTHTVDIKGAIEEAKNRAYKVINVDPLDRLPVIPQVELAPIDEEARARRERNLERTDPTFVPAPAKGQDLIAWGEELVGSLPISAQPVVFDHEGDDPSEPPEEVDIFS